MSDPTLCHYSALGLKKDATLTDIKKAFRKLALEFHPDKVQGEEAKEASSKKFQKVNEAYSILSDEEKRQEYDDRVKLNELRRRAKGEANISAPRTPTSQHYDVRYAEPRPDTFRAKSTTRTTSSAGTKFYSPYPPSSSRLFEDDLYASRQYEDMARTARRQPSYDDKPSKREEERERERRRKDDQEEKNIRAAERKEKERRADKEAAKKLKEKQRRRDGEEKRTHRGEPYLEEDDSLRTSKLDKKKSSSSSKKHDDRDKREKSMPRELVHEEVPDKSAQYMMEAAQYINASRSKVSNPPPLSRSSTFQDYRYAIPPVAVPTPPTAQQAPFPPPPKISVEEDSDEDRPRRSSAKPFARRSSDTPKVRDRSTHKKSGSGSREYVETPPIIIAGHPRIPPHLGKAGSTPPKVPDSPPRQQKLGRAQTLREADFPRGPPSQPPLSRSSTYHYGEFESREPRGRDRSRYQPQVLSEDSDSEEDRRYESRRDRRHRTHSPEFVGHPADYPPPPPRPSATRYGVKKDGRVPMTSEPVYYYPEGASPPSRKAKATTYYEPYSRTPETRPPMPSRGSGYSSSGGYVPHKIKTAQSYTQDDIQYSQMAYQEAAYGY